MIKFLLIAFIACSVKIDQTAAETPTYKCAFMPNYPGETCSVWNANLTQSHKNFKLDLDSHENLTKILRFKFLYSDVDTLTNDVCETLPFIKEFVSSDVGLTSIDSNAFTKCTEMTFLRLERNKLETFPSGVFDFNEKLDRIFLQENKITTLDAELFKNNKNLRYLDLEKNSLTSIPSNLFENCPEMEMIDVSSNELTEFSLGNEMPKLRNLYLHQNNLREIDAADLIQKCPIFNKITLKGNKFECATQNRIIDAVEEETRTLRPGKGVHYFNFDKCDQ